MEDKKVIIESNRVHENDTGSPEVQVALLTARINHLNEHLKANPHDSVSYTHLRGGSKGEAVLELPEGDPG